MNNKFFNNFDDNTPQNQNNDYNNNYMNNIPEPESINYRETKEEAENRIEIENRNADISRIFRIIVFIVAIGATIFMFYQLSLKKQKEENPIVNEPPAETPINTKIEVTETLKNKLISMIPAYSNCKSLYPGQFTEGIVLDSDISVDSLNTTSCSTVPKVYIDIAKENSDEKSVYIYAYVLIYDPYSKYYGRSYNNYNIEYSDIEIDINSNGEAFIIDESFYTYGQLYKFTFTQQSKDVIIYTSTEKVTLNTTNQEE